MKLYFKGVEYDIPIQKDWELTFAIDNTLSSGYVETAPLENNMGALDLSRRIPRGLLVKLERNSRTFYMKTGEVVANKVSFVNGKYKHMINLISLEKDLQRLPLENMTVTQPKGDLGQYSRSVNKLNETLTYDNDIERNVWNIVDNTTVAMINTLNTNTSLFTGMQLLEVKMLNVSIELGVWRKLLLPSDDLTVRIKYNGTTVFTETFTPDAPRLFGNPAFTNKVFNFQYMPTVVGTFTIELFAQGETNLYLETMTFSLSSIEVLDKPIRTYAQVVDKILRQTPYVLSSKGRADLNLTCSEHKFEEYTVYDGLSTLGGDLGALVKVGDELFRRLWKVTPSGSFDIEGDTLAQFSPYDFDLGTIAKIGTRYYVNAETDEVVREINFEFYDKPNVVDIPYQTRHEIAELEDYTSAVELNTKNVVKPLRYSPFKNGFKGVRSNGIGQQTTDNILYEMEDIADRIIEVKVKGRIGKNALGTTVYTEDDVTTLTFHENPFNPGEFIQSHIVNKLLYDTLPSEKDVTYSGKLSLRKHSTLYHQQGSKFIEGLTYLGEDLSLVVGNAAFIRAVYETIDAVRSEEQGELITLTGTTSNNDLGLDEDIKLRFQVTYANITESRARVYKDDQSTFEQETIKYLNESANINESQAIGDYAQLIVNRLGGTKVVFKGIVDDINELPNVGDIDSEGRVYTLIKYKIGRKVKYEITAVQDYNVISNYIGIVSRHRNEEISSSDSVLRTLRYTSRFIFTPTQETFSTRLVSSEDILTSLLTNTDLGLNYAYIECNLSNGEIKRIHLSVDSDNKGKTIEIKVRFKDNYSAGLKRYLENIGGNDVYLNKEVEYTDLYGKVNDILLFIYYDTTAFSAADDEAYPEATTNKGDTLFVAITDTIDKDARETIAGLVEIPIFSEDPEIRVYNGMAKYNKLVEGTDRIRTALLKYVPRKNDKLVDTTRIVDMSVTGSTGFGQFNFDYTALESGNGVVWYHEDTLELVLAYVKDFTAGSYSVTKYYKIQDTIYGGGLNFVASLELITAYSGEIVFQTMTGLELSGTATIQSDITLGQDEYEVTTLEYNVQGVIAVQSAVVALVGNVEVNITVVALAYDWVAGGTSPTVGQTCDLSYDEGNIRCDSSCAYNNIDTYLSQTDDTTLPPPCTQGSTYTTCTDIGLGTFSCNVFEGTITYFNCETCTAIEVEE